MEVEILFFKEKLSPSGEERKTAAFMVTRTCQVIVLALATVWFHSHIDVGLKKIKCEAPISTLTNINRHCG